MDSYDWTQSAMELSKADRAAQMILTLGTASAPTLLLIPLVNVFKS